MRLLGEVLGRVLRHHEGDEIFQRVERVREAAKRARTFNSELEHIDRLLREMPMASALTVARAFAHFLDARQYRRAAPPRASPARPCARPAWAAAARIVPPRHSRDCAAGVARRRAGGRHRLDAGRAGLHGPSHRDRAPHAPPETQPDRADSRVSRSARPDAGRAGRVARGASARDRGGVADRRGAPRACDARSTRCAPGWWCSSRACGRHCRSICAPSIARLSKRPARRCRARSRRFALAPGSAAIATAMPASRRR